MNPITAVQAGVGLVLSIFSMGSSIANQKMMLERQRQLMAQQQVQQMPQCPQIGQQATLVTTTTGQRVWICVEAQP